MHRLSYCGGSQRRRQDFASEGARHGVCVQEIGQKTHKFLHKYNKCIGDDTKAAARQSPNCVKKTKNKMWRKMFSPWRMEFLHPAMWHDHDIDFAR